MKSVIVKIGVLFEKLGLNEYAEYYNVGDIRVKTPTGDFVSINGLVKKRTDMVTLNLENGLSINCAKRHLISTSKGVIFAEDADDVLLFGVPVKVIATIDEGEGDAFDISIPSPHLYQTPNGAVHHNTFLAMYRAIEEVLDRDNPFKQVVVVRSLVNTRDAGFLPGTLEDKQEIYEMPYKEVSTTLFGRSDAWDRLKEQGYARFISTTAIRGISIDDAIIIVDECQSMTFHELSTIISRVGHRSKIIFCGDRFQNDLIYKKNDQSGLELFLEIARSMPSYQEVKFTSDDIVRSSLVREFIVACEQKGVIPTN